MKINTAFKVMESEQLDMITDIKKYNNEHNSGAGTQCKNSMARKIGSIPTRDPQSHAVLFVVPGRSLPFRRSFALVAASLNAQATAAGIELDLAAALAQISDACLQLGLLRSERFNLGPVGQREAANGVVRGDRGCAGEREHQGELPADPSAGITHLVYGFGQCLCGRV